MSSRRQPDDVRPAWDPNRLTRRRRAGGPAGPPPTASTTTPECRPRKKTCRAFSLLRLRNNRARTVDLRVSAANHQLPTEVAVLAYEFEHFPSRCVRHQHPGRKRRCVGSWIVDGDLVAQGLEVETRP